MFLSTYYMSNRKNKGEFPFNSTSSNDFNKLYNKNTGNIITYECNNNDFFTDIDPDLNYINHTNKKCSYYTINEFNKDYFNYSKGKNNCLFHTKTGANKFPLIYVTSLDTFITTTLDQIKEEGCESIR